MPTSNEIIEAVFIFDVHLFALFAIKLSDNLLSNDADSSDTFTQYFQQDCPVHIFETILDFGDWELSIRKLVEPIHAFSRQALSQSQKLPLVWTKQHDTNPVPKQVSLGLIKDLPPCFASIQVAPGKISRDGQKILREKLLCAGSQKPFASLYLWLDLYQEFAWQGWWLLVDILHRKGDEKEEAISSAKEEIREYKCCSRLTSRSD